MKKKRLTTLVLLIGLVLGAGVSFPSDDLFISSTSYVPDKEFPQLMPFIKDGWDLKHGMGEPKPYAEIFPPGATIHAFLWNKSENPASIDGVFLNGIDLAGHILPRHREHRGIRAASYLLNDAETTPEEIKKRLDELGAPIWYRVQPEPVPPGGFSELIIRLRRLPEKKTFTVAASIKGGKKKETRIDIARSSLFSIASVNFDREIKKIYLYLSRKDKEDFEIKSVLLDGREIPLLPNMPRKSVFGFLPLEIPLEKPWEHGSFHYIAVTTTKGEIAAAVIRARDDFFALGMWGYRNHGNTDEERARDTCTTLRDHLFNTHMGMGHAGFLRRTEGLKMLEGLGLRLMTSDPTKADVRDPRLYARFLLDEPDAHEYAIKDLPGHLRVGSYAQGVLELQKRWTKNDPRTLGLLNVDLTYKPENWLIYGQLPDILSADPYYQMRIKDVYWKHPGWLAQFCHPYYVYAISEVVRWASRPRPSHIILNSVSVRKDDKVFRYGTPEEKRIEFYYALMAGAKGISYWWFTPYGKYRGCGSSDPEAKAMMKEMARLNTEARAVLPLLSASCPGTPAGEKFDAFTTCLPYWLMGRTLFAGTDTALVLLVNRDHASDRIGTLYQSIPKAIVSFHKPPWMNEVKAFRFSEGKMEPLPTEKEEGFLKMELRNIDLTEMLILTERPELDKEIRERWNRFAPLLSKE